jgi:D-sedoheptulose 7-phosphate isomerase
MITIEQIIQDSLKTKETLYEQVDIIQSITDRLTSSFRQGHKLLVCGNGGSAADAQHVAAEFIGRFFLERAAIPAIALTANTSSLTALGNDYSYDIVFSRQVEALAQAGDVFAGISTSGNSQNIIQAAKAAKAKGCYTIGFTGCKGGALKDIVDICLCVESTSTPRIQESHILVWHIICELVEAELASGHRADRFIDWAASV